MVMVIYMIEKRMDELISIIDKANIDYYTYDYLKQHKDDLEKIKVSKGNHEDFGQVLGKRPDDNEFIGELRRGERVPWLDDFEWND